MLHLIIIKFKVSTKNTIYVKILMATHCKNKIVRILFIMPHEISDSLDKRENSCDIRLLFNDYYFRNGFSNWNVCV